MQVWGRGEGRSGYFNFQHSLWVELVTPSILISVFYLLCISKVSGEHLDKMKDKNIPFAINRSKVIYKTFLKVSPILLV